eukprot:scaffold5502_cov115-Isochrysis_galbana.AAC.4
MTVTKDRPTHTRSESPMLSAAAPSAAGRAFHAGSTCSRQRPPMMSPASRKSAVFMSHSMVYQNRSSHLWSHRRGHMYTASSVPAQTTPSTADTCSSTSQQ